jgi:hypothetical protein
MAPERGAAVIVASKCDLFREPSLPNLTFRQHPRGARCVSACMVANQTLASSCYGRPPGCDGLVWVLAVDHAGRPFDPGLRSMHLAAFLGEPREKASRKFGPLFNTELDSPCTRPVDLLHVQSAVLSLAAAT